MDADFQAAAADEAFDDGGELAGVFLAVVSGTGESQIGPAADDLGPGAVGRRGVVAVAVLVGGDDQLAAGFFQQRGPQPGAGALPVGEVRAVLRIFVVRRHVSRIVPGIVVEQRDVAEGHQIGGRADFLPGEGVAQPLRLRFAVRPAREQAGEDRVGVEFVFRGVKADQGHVAETDGEIAAEIPVAGQPLFRLAEHPDPFEMPVGHSPAVVVAGREEIGDLAGIVIPFDLRFQEDADLVFDGLFHIAGIAVPDHTGRRQLCNFFDDPTERLPPGVGVVDDAEVGFRLRAGRGETVDMGIFFVAEDFHPVAAVVPDPVGTDPVVIACGRFQAGDPDPDDPVVDVRDAVAPAEELPGVRQVRLFTDQDVAVGQGAHGEGDADRRVGKILQHRRRHEERAFARLLRLRRVLIGICQF